MYLNNNRGKPAIGLEIHQRMRWWELLGSYNGSVRQTLLCPEAMEKGPLSPKDPDGSFGSAHLAWWVARGDYTGSYGWNYWVKGWSEGNTFTNVTGWVRFSPAKAERVPLAG